LTIFIYRNASTAFLTSLKRNRAFETSLSTRVERETELPFAGYFRLSRRRTSEWPRRRRTRWSLGEGGQLPFFEIVWDDPPSRLRRYGGQVAYTGGLSAEARIGERRRNPRQQDHW
jgi:hypothetical protein